MKGIPAKGIWATPDPKPDASRGRYDKTAGHHKTCTCRPCRKKREMDAGTVADILANSLDNESLRNSGLVFGEMTRSGFTLEKGDEKFRITVEKVE